MEKTSETMNLTIKFGVKNIAMSLPASSKVSDLMQQLQTDTDVLPRVQKLIFKGEFLAELISCVLVKDFLLVFWVWIETGIQLWNPVFLAKS